MNICDMIEPLSAMDASVSNNTRGQIRSSDSSVPSPISSQYMASNRMPSSDQKRCQNKINRINSAQNIDCFPQPQPSSSKPFQTNNDEDGNVRAGNSVQSESFRDLPNQPSPISNNKINHYHKIHKNVRNRARKFDNNRSSKSAFLGGLFTDLTASEDTLLLENGDVHQMNERSKLSSKDPTINMPSIFGSISNMNNNNSALICESPGASGAISKNTRPPRKSVNIRSPTKEAVARVNNEVTNTSSNEDKRNVHKDDKRRRNPDIPQNRSVSDQIGIEKAISPTVKGKKAPQVRILCVN